MDRTAGLPPPSSPILERQDSPDMIALLKAMTVSHRRARRLDVVTVAVSVVLAGSSLAATFARGLVVPVAVLGAAWAVAYVTGLADWARSEFQRAATIQEMFDVELFGLPWNRVAAGDPVGVHEVSWLAQQYRGPADELYGYYEIPPLAGPYDVVACQLQNLAWGARVRQRYARLLLTAIGIWCTAGLVIGVFGGLAVVQIALRWYVPSLGALLLAWNSARGQRGVAAERERVMGIVWQQVRATLGQPGADAVLLGTARQVQDAILLTRRCDVRVPDWFFNRFKPVDRVDFQAVMAELVRVLATAPAAGSPGAR